jgi:hypothetical protein
MNLGSVYLWQPDSNLASGGSVVRAVVPLLRLSGAPEGGTHLAGRHVIVRNAGELNHRDEARGGVVRVPISDAQPDANGDFVFDPGRGGPRMDKRAPRKEKYRARYIGASHFGEVNTYYHVDRIAAYVDELLRELGAPPLPRVIAIVNAHHAAVDRLDGTRDGIVHRRGWVPFQGGHYRLPGRTASTPEHSPVAAEGEIHLGPGWKLLEHGALVDLARARYRHNASHNAGTIYHEYGHHISRHTADFRANGFRPADRQSNRKTALDEGFSDYWAATMLDTPFIWAWHRRHDDEEFHDRSLTCPVTMADYDSTSSADAHANGTIWAVGLWSLRCRMKAEDPDGARQCDKLVLRTLCILGGELGSITPLTVKSVRRARSGFELGLSIMLRADAHSFGDRYRNAILDVFAERGIVPADGVPLASGSSTRDGHETPLEPAPGGPARASRLRRLDSGWAETPRSLAELESARARLAKHVAREDLPETEHIFGRGELDAELARLNEPPLSVLASGDTMLGGRSRGVIAERGLAYPFRALRPLLRRASIVLGNLEGPMAIEARKEPNNPRNFAYRVEPRMGVALRRAGFKVMTLANNHLLDCGRQGVLETLEVMKRLGIATIGAGGNERAAHAPAILEAEGLRVGFLGYYWNRRTSARGSLPGSAMDLPEALARDIPSLCAVTDRVVVTFHWGVPYERAPSADDQLKARMAIDLGADVVIGHHTHVIQPFEVHRCRPIFYGIGNCAFGSGNSKGEGLLVGIRFEPERTLVRVYPLYVKNRDPRVDYQPKVLRGAAARRVFSRMASSPADGGGPWNVEEFRATLDLPWQRRSTRQDEARVVRGGSP